MNPIPNKDAHESRTKGSLPLDIACEVYDPETGEQMFSTGYKIHSNLALVQHFFRQNGLELLPIITTVPFDRNRRHSCGRRGREHDLCPELKLSSDEDEPGTSGQSTSTHRGRKRRRSSGRKRSSSGCTFASSSGGNVAGMNQGLGQASHASAQSEAEASNNDNEDPVPADQNTKDGSQPIA